MPGRYETQKMYLKPFVTRLNKATEPLGIFNELKTDHEVEPGFVCTSGLWVSKHELPENDSRADIRVLWHHNPKERKIQMTPALWNRRRYFFWQNVMHEQLHRYQDQLRPGNAKKFVSRSTARDTKESQVYYGSYDEIETHSHAAAVELMVWWPDLSYRDAIMAAHSYSGRMVDPTYNLFTAAFVDAPNHPALKSFKWKLKTWYAYVTTHREIYDLLVLPKLV